MIDYTPHITQKRLTALRRLFHKHAETGMAEFWTTARIAEEAEALGLAPLMGESVSAPEARMGVPDENTLDKARQRAEEEGAQKRLLDAMNGVTGLVVDIRPDLPAHTVLRFDIDAVDVQESGSASHLPRREGFFSLHEGICHACGHDGHIALGLGLAHELVRLRECLTHNVRLLFQPGEEGCRGARAMAAAGLLDGARHMVAAHIGMWADCDHSLVCGAQGFLATTQGRQLPSRRRKRRTQHARPAPARRRRFPRDRRQARGGKRPQHHSLIGPHGVRNARSQHRRQ